MNSYLTDDFLSYYQKLPKSVKKKARENYRLWKQNPNHPSLQFKRVHPTEPIYSVRVGTGWRALGLKENNSIYWFWIGSHGDYDRILSQL
ncbi:hypothetical protein FJZ31_18860 [Candidatus Poribacteria bacterium]|nr:hypothetical protein [Candidatus Poribacteria bacterium]